VDQNYEGKYDFLLLFPAKKTSRLNNCSYAFINFITAADAKKFRDDFHLHRFMQNAPEADAKNQWPLSIAIAKVQGFAENFMRFHHLVEGTNNTLCKPFFYPRAVLNLPREILEAAKQQTGGGQSNEPATVVVRNLPMSIDSQDLARDWFDGAGYSGKYDFFLYLPPKKRRADLAPAGQGLAYAFVNFRDPKDAKACMAEHDGTIIPGAKVALSIVPAKIQGAKECWDHFRGLKDSGRLEPWVCDDVIADSTAAVTTTVTRAPGAPPGPEGSGLQAFQ